ncbi:MAG: rRNA maturation RNase YbeY [Myxococcota bacterium]|jgi:probable rRNA maturation factor|nr:rRNA maturation RNase YbeY [Myxococcota bacterium]
MPAFVRTSGLRSTPIRPAVVRERAEKMLAALKLESAELSILLCDDPTIHALNRDFRHKDKPTDVLAFAMREGEGGDLAGGILGDVVVSLDTARRQAAERGHAIASEITFLLAHGLLHLVGYDHRNDAEERVMNAETSKLVDVALGRTPPPEACGEMVEERGKRTRRGKKPAKKSQSKR